MPNHSRPKTAKCAMCGKPGLVVRRITRSYGRGAALLVIENVPVLMCLHCGESYLTAKTLHEVERIKLHRRSFASRRRVSRASHQRDRGERADKALHRTAAGAIVSGRR